jgi:UDP-N-acetylglucosamine--N-acetylmuramyl-(pentapeptide) pyrophosphoryl-undecaprenol N-acetylglucosamine transferase
MRVMITGGGTGGHTSPAVAIVDELRRRDPQLMVQWVGKAGAIEERVARGADIPFRAVPAAGWPRSRSPRRLWVALVMALGYVKAAMLVRSFRPQVVIGVGGYVSLPLLLAAQHAGIPTVLHEQNKRLGMANRLLAAKCARLFLSYPDTLGAFPRDRAEVVGNPVRPGFISPPTRAEARAKLGLDAGTPVVLVVGGSQGARSINEAMAGAVHMFDRDEAQFLWMTGKAGEEAARDAAVRAKARVDVFPFIDDMVGACAAADLIVARAGASSAAEIAALGKPSILVPFPFATDNHQEQNARAFESAGAAEVLLDADCKAVRLSDAIRGLLEDDARREAMGAAAKSLAKPLAAENVVEGIMALLFGRETGAP